MTAQQAHVGHTTTKKHNSFESTQASNCHTQAENANNLNLNNLEGGCETQRTKMRRQGARLQADKTVSQSLDTKNTVAPCQLGSLLRVSR